MRSFWNFFPGSKGFRRGVVIPTGQQPQATAADAVFCPGAQRFRLPPGHPRYRRHAPFSGGDRAGARNGMDRAGPFQTPGSALRLISSPYGASRASGKARREVLVLVRSPGSSTSRCFTRIVGDGGGFALMREPLHPASTAEQGSSPPAGSSPPSRIVCRPQVLAAVFSHPVACKPAAYRALPFAA